MAAKIKTKGGSMIICEHILLWGFIATLTMACIQEGTLLLGVSRMSFPFLIGTFFSGKRGFAVIIGFLCYLVGGWLYTIAYFYFFKIFGYGDVRVGACLGFFQGIVMLLILLPLLPYIHPRMSTNYDGPTSKRTIEPPGFMALHYGKRAPIIHLIGQIAFGAIVGAAYARG